MTACIRRREFITLLGSAAMAWPSSAPAQQSQRVRRIGVLANEPWPALEGLYEGMRELGYGEGEGLLIEYRFAEGAAERFPGLASELVPFRSLCRPATRSVPAWLPASPSPGET
jgi:putative ABC transport system substrate-binding protein